MNTGQAIAFRLGVDSSANIASIGECSAEFFSGQKAGDHIYYEFDTEPLAAVILEN
jgi:hypothetical protein